MHDRISPCTPSGTSQATRLGSMTARWRVYCRRKGATPPMDAHQPVEIRALTSDTALDLMAAWMPHLQVLKDKHGNYLIDRIASTPSSPPAS